MLYVQYVHLIRPSIFIGDTPILSSGVLHKDYDRKGSVEKISGRESQGSCRQDELIGGKPPVVKQLWLWNELLAISSQSEPGIAG
jgi:hypothetical protein